MKPALTGGNSRILEADVADDKQSGPGLGGNSIILLVAAAASAVYMGWRNPPLFSTRPTEPDYEISQTKSTQDIDARLWQDPFGAVNRSIENKRGAKIDPDDGHRVADFLAALESGAESTETLLIGVDLPGDPYPEAVETRRRLRYAVLSALHVAKYVPADERHIGYLSTAKPRKPETVASGFLQVTPPADGDALKAGVFGEGVFKVTTNAAAKPQGAADDDKLSVPAIVPFEQFEGLDSKKRVIVLWLDEEALAHRQNPIASLASLLCKLNLGQRSNESFVFLGPQDSDVLQRMVQEVKGDKDQALKQNCPLPEGELSVSASVSTKAQPHEAAKAKQHKPLTGDLPIYNYGATAKDRIIIQRAGVLEKTDIASLFRDRNINYYRTISSDEELAEVLAQELSRRGIDLCPKQISRDIVPPPGSPCPRPHHDRVFLLSEWDTAYGRYLPQSVSETFGADNSSFAGCHLNTSHGIMHASYLRGLDGRLPSRRAAKEAQSSGGQHDRQTPGQSSEQPDGGEPSATPETIGRFESAEGQSQFDYLRRLTETLKECDKQLRFEGAGRIAAIGVLGSDVYDKLLLLQALRPAFPDATFFTTDLDELLLPQDKLRYTRNLLVASGYGLTLTPDLQKDVLPFRSSYQTSIFLATTLAIKNDALAHPKTEVKGDPWPDTTAALGCWSKQPLLFQIGRTIARGLPTGSVDGADAACRARGGRATDDFIKYASIDPNVDKLYPEFTLGARVGIFLIPIALLGALLSLSGVRRVCFTKTAPAEGSGRLEVSGQTKIQPGLEWVIPLLVVTVITWVLVTLFWPVTARWLTEYPQNNGDPMALLEGISIWPTIALRAFGGILSLLLIWWTLRTLEINRYETGRDMGLPIRPGTTSLAEDYQEMVTNLDLRTRRAKLAAMLWFPPESSYRNPQGCDDSGRRRVEFLHIVTRLSLRSRIRCLRAALATVVMILLWSLVLAPLFGDLTVPARGTRAREIYWWVTLLDVMPTLFLTFLVADATLYSRTFISRLTQISTVWPDPTFAKFARRYCLSRNALADWIDLQYLAKRTECITQLIYFPFLSLTVLFLSRSHLFDDFSMPWTLPASQAISVAVIIVSVLAYRLAAENARRAARNHLTAKIVAARGDEKKVGRLERILTEIESLREGAFAPLTSQPIVKAVLLPLVTYGGAWLAHIYGLPGT